MIRLSKSCIGLNEKNAVLGVLDREMLGMGNDVQEFERQLSDFFGRPAVCVSTGTAALQLAIQCLGLSDGDEVLVPSLTYVASFQAISATGAKPVACDIGEDMFINLLDAEKRITKKTKAIMPVHYSGGVGNLDDVYSLARKYNLRVVEDAAHAFGTIYQGKRVGSFGDLVCFSFDGIKNITSGEGGCIVSSDQLVMDKIKDARLLGVMNDTQKRYEGKRSWNFDVTEQGWRYHMSNIMAAIGSEQLKRFPEFAKIRQARAKEYDIYLKEIPEILTLQRDYDTVVPHIYPIRILSKVGREEVREILLTKGIQTGIHYLPNHFLSYFQNQDSVANFPKTEEIYQQILTLPLHADLSKENVVEICNAIVEIFKK